MDYPSVKRENVCDLHHRVSVPDPYRWLEEPHTSPEVASFVQEQNDLTDTYLSSSRVKSFYRRRLEEIWDVPKYGCPERYGTRIFFAYNSGMSNFASIYVKDTNDVDCGDDVRDLLNGASVLIDDQRLLPMASMRQVAFSSDGTRVAYAYNTGDGSDWVDVKFLQLSSPGLKSPCVTNLSDVLENTKHSSLSWYRNRGIFYNRYESVSKDSFCQNLGQTLCFHELSDDDNNNKGDGDVKVLAFPSHPEWHVHATVTECQKYLVCLVRDRCRVENKVWIARIDDSFLEPPPTNLSIPKFLPFRFRFDDWTAQFNFVGNLGDEFFFRTNFDSEFYSLVSFDLSMGREDDSSLVSLRPMIVVPEAPGKLLESAVPFHDDKVILVYQENVINRLAVFHLSRRRFLSDARLKLPLGSIQSIFGRRESKLAYFLFVSFLQASTIFRVRIADDGDPILELINRVPVLGFDETLFETKQVFYSSADGQKIPMFLTHRKNVELNGRNPVMLYGYGGFNQSVKPLFSPSRIVFIQHMNGIVAVPNLRGGGELGKHWHEMGRRKNKKNTIDDFISAAQFLVGEGFCIPSKIVVNGASNGGLTAALAFLRRPDLFACAILQVGVFDLLRFHLYTIGFCWIPEYGDPDEATDFRWLLRYSPYHRTLLHAGEKFERRSSMETDEGNRDSIELVPHHFPHPTATSNSFHESPALSHQHDSYMGLADPSSSCVDLFCNTTPTTSFASQMRLDLVSFINQSQMLSDDEDGSSTPDLSDCNKKIFLSLDETPIKFSPVQTLEVNRNGDLSLDDEAFDLDVERLDDDDDDDDHDSFYHSQIDPSYKRLFPSVFCLTSTTDDRVVPMHSFKFVAALQHFLRFSAEDIEPVEEGVVRNLPVALLRVADKSGHGYGKGTDKAISELEDIFAFIDKTVDLEWHD